jgi:hypothetical protein
VALPDIALCEGSGSGFGAADASATAAATAQATAQAIASAFAKVGLEPSTPYQRITEGLA